MALRVTRVALQVAGLYEDTGQVIPDSPGTIFSVIKRNNWVTPVRMERAWQTDVTMANDTIAEERWGLRSRPLLTQTTQLTGGLAGVDAADLLITLARYAQHGNPVPIYPDRTRLTAAVATGANRIYCDTAHRRFFIGQRIGIAPRDWDVIPVTGAYAPVEFTTIVAITATYIDILDGIQSTAGYFAGAWVFPMFDAEAVLNMEYDRVTSNTIDGEITWIEKSGASSLPSVLNSPHVTVPIFFTHEGYPILDARMNGTIKGKILRDGTRYSSGRASVIDLRGDLSRFGIDAEFKHVTRFAWWRFTAFFDTVKGRLGTFWFVNPQDLWTLDSVQSSTVFRVRRTHYYHVFDPTISVSSDAKPSWLQHFCVVKNDLRPYIAGVSSVAEVSQDLWDITVDAALPTTNIKRITAAHLGRFEEDVLRDNWITQEIVTTSMSMIQVHEEKSVTITNL